MERILIIDDDINVLKVLDFALVLEGYEVLRATDGKQGMKLYRENPVDLIITDLIMPEKEGLETIIELKKSFRTLKSSRFPVVGISVHRII